jgi:oxygen-independent coproporphyrinogen-3 oxidase
VTSFRHVYVHVPFCARRCTYCDFSIAVRRSVPVAEYLRALERELAVAGPVASPQTIYLGGGTPSHLGPDGIEALSRLLGVREQPVEFTIEANPDDVTEEAARRWRAAGINRVSLGAQSFDDGVLRWMHRTHDSTRIGEAVRHARGAGFDNVSLDLIFGLPDMLGRDLDADLDRVLELSPEHLSLYGLTIETGTALARQIGRGEIAPPPDERYGEEYLRIVARLAAEGYRFYEVSNAARGGREAVHNRAYWRLAPYLGYGPSAHSFDGVARWWNEPAYAAWTRRLAAGQSPVAGRELLSEPQRRLESLYLGLRTAEGVEWLAESPPELAALSGRVSQWLARGWAVYDGRRLALTPEGWLRLDALVASL